MRRYAILLALCLLAVSLIATSAAAAKTVELHTYAGSFEGSDANGGPAFGSGSLDKIGVDRATGAVLVATSSSIYKFDSGGTSSPFSSVAPVTVLPGGVGSGNAGGFAVDNSGGATQGRFYAFPEFNVMRGYLPGGESAPGFPVAGSGDLCGVAVDGSGNIWRQTYGGDLTEYAPDGTPTGQEVSIEGPHGFCAFEMDAEGNFYVPSSYAGGPVSKYGPSGELIQLIDPGRASDVAVDRSTGDIYVDVGSTIDHLNSSGELIETLGELSESNGVAVNSATHTVYALDNGSPTQVQIFTSSGPATVASAKTEPATEITRTGGTINGKVNPEGITTTDCRFEYGPAYGSSYPESVPCVEGNSFSGSTETAVSAVIEGSEPETEFKYRLRVTNANGPAYGATRTFKTYGAVKATQTEEATDIDATHATLNGSFDPDGIDTHYWFQYGTNYGFEFSAPVPGPPGEDAGSTPGITHVSAALSGLESGTSAQGKEYQYRLVAENEVGRTYGEILSFHTPPNVQGVVTLPATNPTLTSATLNGEFNPSGISTRYLFEYGATASYGSYAPVEPPGEDGGDENAPVTVSAPISGFEAGGTVHFRIVAVNANGTTVGEDTTVRLGEAPRISGDRATEINTDTTVLEATVNPDGRATTYHWEYGTEDCSVVTCEQTAPVTLPTGVAGVTVRYTLEGLTPGGTYHFRLIASNSLGTATGEDHSFITYTPESGIDTCPNVLERKQTGAAATAHCRAYELVSAANTGGYDVESNLIAGLNPLPGFPNADGKVLYTVRFGSVPGSGNPPNKGGDPYVATRGENGWTTEYVGLQANGTPSTVPFASTLSEADQHLDTFAFGGPELCSPCFSDGSRNIPLRLPGGSLVKGMAGSENPAAEPAGEIAKRFSGDGGSFIFGSTSQFEPAGNEGSLSIYERDLGTNATQVVSTMPDGSTMPGPGTAELDVSEDGSRVLIGRQVGTDAGGNPLYDLYMHVGDDPHSVLVAAPTGGALYAGMSADGSKVYFTTTEALGSDSDSSADLFRADVPAIGATVTQVSTGSGGSGNSDACDPVSNADGNHWNEPGASSSATCGVVAIGGGGGVASESGAAYFLSPENLEPGSEAVPDQPNLYLAEPGSQPQFVATLDPDDAVVRDAVAAAAERNSADFQTTPDGDFAAFVSRTPLTHGNTAGHDEIYRSEAGGGLACISCIPSNGAPSSDTELTKNGLNLVDDGRVFFTSKEQLVLRDTNRLKDAYEWDKGHISLISTGLDSNDSGLLTASADGKDAFFFTRQTLAPQDENGGAMKIYDAREDGGFLYNPPPRPCVASDECHGPGTKQAPSPAINTIEGTGEPQPPIGKPKKPAKCHKGLVKRHGKCVKAQKQKKGKKKAGKHGRGKEPRHG